MSRIIKLNVSTGWANCDYDEDLELPDDWDEWTEDARDKFLSDAAMDFMFECCECSAWVEDED